MNDVLESEVLQMITCGCVNKIKEGLKVNMNQGDEEVQSNITKKNEDDTPMIGSTCAVPSTKGPTLGINVSCCMTHMSWGKSEEEAMTTYTHPF